MTQAKEKAAHTESFIAGEDLSSNQYHGAKMNGNRTVDLVDAITDKPVGVIQNEPTSGRETLVTVLGTSPLVLEETLVAGDHFRFNANGKAVKWEAGTDTTTYRAGFITIGGASGEVGEGVVIPGGRGDQ